MPDLFEEPFDQISGAVQMQAEADHVLSISTRV